MVNRKITKKRTLLKSGALKGKGGGVTEDGRRASFESVLNASLTGWEADEG